MIAKDYDNNSVALDTDVHTDLTSIINNHNDDIITSYPEDSFQHIFWCNQGDAIKKNPNGIRWHSSMIKWCIYLKHKSAGAYEMLRKTNCITLPSQRTLRAYTHYYKSSAGFSIELDEQLVQETMNYSNTRKPLYS